MVPLSQCLQDPPHIPTYPNLHTLLFSLTSIKEQRKKKEDKIKTTTKKKPKQRDKAQFWAAGVTAALAVFCFTSSVVIVLLCNSFLLV